MQIMIFGCQLQADYNKCMVQDFHWLGYASVRAGGIWKTSVLRPQFMINLKLHLKIKSVAFYFLFLRD